jgi:hypothetical protein
MTQYADTMPSHSCHIVIFVTVVSLPLSTCWVWFCGIETIIPYEFIHRPSIILRWGLGSKIFLHARWHTFISNMALCVMLLHLEPVLIRERLGEYLDLGKIRSFMLWTLEMMSGTCSVHGREIDLKMNGMRGHVDRIYCSQDKAPVTGYTHRINLQVW